MSTTATASITTEIVAILIADGWHRTWPKCENSVTDEYRNIAHIHAGEESVKIEFEYGLPGLVETLNLDPDHGARRIARVVSTLADAPDL